MKGNHVMMNTLTMAFVCLIAASGVGLAGVAVKTAPGVIDTRRPIARASTVGQVDTTPLRFAIIIR